MAKGYNHSYTKWWNKQGGKIDEVYRRSPFGVNEQLVYDSYVDSLNQRGWRSHGSFSPDEASYVAEHHRRANAKLGFNQTLPNAKGAETKKAVGFGKLGWAAVGIDTVMNMKAGDSFGTAAAKGVVSGMLWTTMPGIMTAHMLASSAPGAVSAYSNYKRQKEVWWNSSHSPNFGGNYQDTSRAQTMRQAAVQAIQGSKMNARSALGGEARILSQGMYRG